jgi:uncharacterized membrane protein
MTSMFAVDPVSLAAIVGMALVTYAIRVSGLALAFRLRLSPRATEAFEAVPAAVLTAVIAPTVLLSGRPETIAAAVTALAASRLPLIVTVIIGVATLVVLRSWLG